MKYLIVLMLIVVTNCYAQSDDWTFSVTLQGFNYTTMIENQDTSFYDVNNKKLNNGEIPK